MRRRPICGYRRLGERRMRVNATALIANPGAASPHRLARSPGPSAAARGSSRQLLQRCSGLPEYSYSTGGDNRAREDGDVPPLCSCSPASVRRESNRTHAPLHADRQTESLQPGRCRHAPPCLEKVASREAEHLENSWSREIDNLLQIDLGEESQPWLGGCAQACKPTTILKLRDVFGLGEV